MCHVSCIRCQVSVVADVLKFWSSSLIFFYSTQGVTNNSVFEYYLNSQTKQQYSHSVFGFSQYRIVFGTRYSGFLHPEQYSGIQIFGPNTCPNSFTNLQNKMSCMGQIPLFQFHFFQNVVYYSVFRIRYSNSWTEKYYSYSVLGFS